MGPSPGTLAYEVFAAQAKLAWFESVGVSALHKHPPFCFKFECWLS